MVTVCLADQLLPDASPKMRQVLRRALRIQRDQFGIEDPATIAEMTFDLTECVLDTLSFHYPSPDLKKDLISSVLHFEVENMVEQDAQNNKAMNKLVTLVRALPLAFNILGNLSVDLLMKKFECLLNICLDFLIIIFFPQTLTFY